MHTQTKSSALQLGVSNKNQEMLTSKIDALEENIQDMKLQLHAESEKRKDVEKEMETVRQSKRQTEQELEDIKAICIKYEGTVSELNEEISRLESELATIKESLGEDSPLLEVAEIQARAAFSGKEVESLRTRLEGFAADNENLNGKTIYNCVKYLYKIGFIIVYTFECGFVAKLKETTGALESAKSEREQTNSRLHVLEVYFKEREEEYIKSIEQLQLKEGIRDKGKEELIRMIEEKDNVCKDLSDRLEALRDELEETKQQHRNEIRAIEAKGHENWVSR